MRDISWNDNILQFEVDEFCTECFVRLCLSKYNGKVCRIAWDTSHDKQHEQLHAGQGILHKFHWVEAAHWET
jgi:hypothetical protein